MDAEESANLIDNSKTINKNDEYITESENSAQETKDDEVQGILRSKNNDSIIFYANLSDTTKVISLENVSGFSDVITKNLITSTNHIKLAPWSYLLLENE